MRRLYTEIFSAERIALVDKCALLAYCIVRISSVFSAVLCLAGLAARAYTVSSPRGVAAPGKQVLGRCAGRQRIGGTVGFYREPGGVSGLGFFASPPGQPTSNP
jgi:hypothetical protein